MYQRWLGICLASIAALGAGTALAQPATGCPAGHAVQSSDMSGRSVACIPVPDGAALLDAIAQEQVARIAADDELRAAIGGGQASMAGVYAVSGTQECTTASRGFTPSLQPIVMFSPPPPEPPLVTTISVTAAKITGTMVLDAGGSGRAELIFHNIGHPGHLFGPVGTASTGGGTLSSATGEFTWEVTADNQLIIHDANLEGRVINGASPGTTIRTASSPRLVGLVGQDRKLISLFQEDMVVEQQILTLPSGLTINQQRVCARERTLRKL